MKSPRAPQWEKNNTGSQLCLCSILCCDCFHLVCFLPCRAINPTEIFMKFNNQSFKSLTLSPMAFCKKSNCSITVLLWLPVAREQPQKLFSLRQPLSHKPDSSFRPRHHEHYTWSPEGHSLVIVCMTSPGNFVV